jgi:DNA-binding MarR family transcriptional regulator
VRRYLGALLEPYGLTVQLYNVLRILRGARPEALPPMDIADRMIEQAPGITRLLDRLDAKGLVGRARCLADRRQVLCTITERGLDLLAELDAPVDAADQRVLAALDDAEVTSLVHLLDRLRAGLG